MRDANPFSENSLQMSDSGGHSISDPTNRGVSPLASDTSSPPRRTTLQNAVLTAGVVLTIAAWIAAGWIFLARNMSPKLPPSVADKPATVADNPTPVVDDEESVDPAARELIMRGWAMYYMPYAPVRWQEARRDFERALELDSRSSEARIGLASILSTKLADGWSPVLQNDLPRA